MSNSSNHSVFHALPQQMGRYVAIGLIALCAGCAVKPAPTAAPTSEELARRQRVERVQTTLNDGLKQYEAGSYEAAMKSLLVALDSGILTVPQQLVARKHMAFIQCVNNRELICKEEFEKAFLLDPNFNLTPAEAGHPTWGPIFRVVRTEIELRKTGRVIAAPVVKPLPPAEKMMGDAMKAYDEADYPKAIKLLQDAQKEKLAPAELIRALKFTAFSYCLTNQLTLCRNEFEKILQLNPAFELDAAEAGHPSWGPPFRAVKAKQKQVPAKK